MKKWLWEKLGDLAQEFKSRGRSEEAHLLEGLRFRHYCREGGGKECLFGKDDLKKIMVKKWGEVGGFQVWLVDGEVIRDQWDDDFIGGGNGYRYSYIPKDQIWIDRDTGKGDLIPYLYHELVEAVLMREGLDYSKAHEMAAWREGVLRSKKGEEERKFLKVAGESWYHISPRWRTESILEKGLIVGRENLGFTNPGNWAEEWYGVWPIFCSKEPWNYPSDMEEWSLFSVDLSGLKLAADLPSLIDSGAYLGEEGYIHWGGEVPEQLKDLDDDGEFKIEDFIYDKFFIEASIDLTGTVAVLESISPSRIKLIDWEG